MVVRSLGTGKKPPFARGPGRRPGIGPRSAISGLDHIEKVHYWAIEDLKQLIFHVRTLIDGYQAIAEPVIDWLDRLLQTSEDLQKWVVDKKLHQEGPFSENNSRDVEEIDGLRYLCADEMVMLEELFIDLDNETSRDALLTDLLDYWVQEVRDRSFDVYHLFTGAIVWDDVKHAAEALATMQYPTVD
jgi:hypothetical protein